MIERFILRLARALVGIAQRVVPATRRVPWRAEWEHELERWWDELPSQCRRAWSYRWRLVRRAALCFADAWAVRSYAIHGPPTHSHLITHRSDAMQETIQDLRYAIRTLARNPVFATVTVLTLALGIGANTAVFSVINTVLLRPLPYDEPDRLALVWTNFGNDLPQNWISGPEYAEMQEFNTTFESLGLAIPFNVTVTGNGEPVQVSGGAVSGNFFDVMRTGPQVGRLIGMGDDQPGAVPVIVLSDGFWRRRYGADPSIVGQTIMVNAQAYEVIGILSPEFEILHPDAGFPARIDVWGAILPLFGTFFGRPVDYPTLPRGNHGFRGIGRLKPGITIAQAQADMDAVAVSMQEVAGGA
ncbi:MAG: ABC transporter permease, partial [Gemmatimonadetes bacterium]|nr:ABC transporter permease [Gemmatimonadota bacterium]